MFDISKVVTQPTVIEEETSSYEVLRDLSHKYYKVMSSSHHKWINKQKTLFSKLKYDDADMNMYKILTNKYDEHLSSAESVFHHAMKSIGKFVLMNDTEDYRRIQTIKAFLNNHPGLGMQTFAPVNDIAYKSDYSYIEDKDIVKAYTNFFTYLENPTELDTEMAMTFIPKDYRKVGNLVEYHKEVILKEDKNYRIEEIVEEYDKEILGKRIDLMKKNGEEFTKSNDMIEKMHKKCIEKWEKTMKRLSSIEDDDEKEHSNRIMMSTMSVLNSFTEKMKDNNFTIMKDTLKMIADSDRASNILTKAIMQHCLDNTDTK